MHKLDRSQSLYEIGDGVVRIYIRYSKVHGNSRTFYGLREFDQPGNVPEFTHSQMQTLLGAIEAVKGYDIWVPQSDRVNLDWLLTDHFECRDVLPFGYDPAEGILQEVDVIWVQRGSSELRALFEVEHSTPIYSGLLRFNDIHLVAPGLRPRFSIVANDARRALFVRQLNRPTFQVSGLSELCTFLEYINVFGWYKRIKEYR